MVETGGHTGNKKSLPSCGVALLELVRRTEAPGTKADE